MAPLFGVPAAPADFFEVDVAVEAAGFAAAAAAFEGADDEAARFGRGDAGEAGHGGGEVAHDVADGEGAVAEEDAGEVVFGEEAGGDGAGGVEPGEVAGVMAQREATLGLVLSFGVVDCILQVYVRVHVGRAGGGSGRHGGGAAFVVEGVGRQRRGDGVGGRGQHAGLLLGREGPGGDSGEAVAARPEASVVRLGDIDGCGHASQSHGDAGAVLGDGSHVGYLSRGGRFSVEHSG